MKEYRFRKKSMACASKFRGVTWDKRGKKWMAQFAALGVRKFLGYFPTEILAARAYDAAARKVFKTQTAALNFPKS